MKKFVKDEKLNEVFTDLTESELPDKSVLKKAEEELERRANCPPQTENKGNKSYKWLKIFAPVLSCCLALAVTLGVVFGDPLPMKGGDNAASGNYFYTDSEINKKSVSASEVAGLNLEKFKNTDGIEIIEEKYTANYLKLAEGDGELLSVTVYLNFKDNGQIKTFSALLEYTDRIYKDFDYKDNSAVRPPTADGDVPSDSSDEDFSSGYITVGEAKCFVKVNSPDKKDKERFISLLFDRQSEKESE